MPNARYHEVLDEVKRLVAERVQDDPLGGDAQPGTESIDIDEKLGLDVYGLDSIDLTVIFSHFEQEWGLVFDNDAVSPEGYPSVASLVDAIAGQIPD